MRHADDAKVKGLRVLIVEDEYIVAKTLEMVLREMGCEVVGPAANSEEACELIKRQPVDAALLDISLSPGTCEPVARALRYRSLPFVFVTGYGNINLLPDDLRGYRVLIKPADRDSLVAAVHELAESAART